VIDFDDALTVLRHRSDARLVAVDGLPVSGKSALVERLETELGAICIYIDDFVRPEAEWRGVATPAFPFPYFRYDEFLGAVMAIASGEIARYWRYDWQAGRVSDDWREVRPEGVVVVDGVSALHPDLAPLYDLRLWVDSDAASTLEAALLRGVGDWEHEWRHLFMPSVAIYLATNPQNRADQVVAGRGAKG
jgi:uridine kinase